MKGIILAGGTGTRLYPATCVMTKQLLPLYDKPMIYYPLCTLLLAGLQNILIITTPNEKNLFSQLLGNGSKLGIQLNYTTQEKPGGIAQAFLIGEKFIDDESVCLILGDNVLYGQGLARQLQRHNKLKEGAVVFAYPVRNPQEYGVVNFNKKGKAISIEEKPKNPTSKYAVIGLYYYDNKVVEYAKQLKPSERNELEITSINQKYLELEKLQVEKIGRGVAWLDTGSHRSMLDASRFISIIEERQGLKLACPEEVAWRMKYIDDMQLKSLAEPLCKSGYGEYLLNLLEE